MAVKIFEIHRLGTDGKRHAQAVAGVLFGTAQLASVGVGADIFLDQLRVGAEAAGGKNRGASAQFNLCAVLLGDQARDAAVLDDEPHTFAAVQIASAEIQKLFLEAGEGAAADVFLIDRAVGDFALLIEPDSSRSGLFDLDTDNLQPLDGAAASFRPGLDEIGVANPFRHDEVVELGGGGLRALAAGAQTAGGHQDIAITQLAAAFVDQENFGASFRGAYRGGEAC